MAVPAEVDQGHQNWQASSQQPAASSQHQQPAASTSTSTSSSTQLSALSTQRLVSTLYLSAQSALAAGWWALLVLRPESRTWFRPADGPDVMLLAFWMADLTCVVLGSAIAAWLVHRRHGRRATALAFLCGAMVYATLYCVALSLMTGEAWLGVALMLPATAVSVAIARTESRP